MSRAKVPRAPDAITAIIDLGLRQDQIAELTRLAAARTALA